MAQFKLNVANAYFESKSMKNGIIIYIKKIITGKAKYVDLSKSRTRIGMVWLY